MPFWFLMVVKFVACVFLLTVFPTLLFAGLVIQQLAVNPVTVCDE